MKDKLKPCPFCGCDFIATIRTPHKICRVCIRCSAEGPEEVTEEGAVKKWNKRK